MLNLHSVLVPFLALAGLIAPGWLGVMLAEDDNGRPTVSEVVPDSPAAKAGIKAGDVILALDDTKTDSVDTLVSTVAAREAGSKVKVKLLRDGKQQMIEVELGTRPGDLSLPARGAVRVAVPAKAKKEGQEQEKKEGQKKEEAKAEPKTGLVPREPKPAAKPYLGVALEEVDGQVRVTDVVDGSPAKKAGLEKGVLVSIAGTRIASLDDVDKVMSGLRAGQKVQISTREGDKTETVEVVLGAPAASGKGEGKGEAAAAEGAGRAAAEAVARAQKDHEAAARAARAAAEKTRAEVEKTRAQLERSIAEANEKSKTVAPRVLVAPAPATDKPSEKSDVRAALREAKGKRPLLLVFGASWDASTKALKKSLDDDKVKSALGDRKLLWIDTDQNGQLADEYEVQQIPHMVLLDANGKRAEVIEGFQPAEILVERLTSNHAAAVASKVPGPSGPRQPGPSGPTTAGPKSPGPSGPTNPKKADKPAGERDLQDEVRALRDEIRELRGMLQELMRERRR